MRLTDIEEVPADIHVMLLKLRKGAAASLTAKRLAEIFAYLPGWKIEKSKFDKLSEGGHALKKFDVPGVSHWINYRKRNDGKILYERSSVIGRGSEQYENSDGGYGRAADERKMVDLKDVVYPRLKAIDGMKQKGWMVSDVALDEYDNDHHHYVRVVFNFIVSCSGFLITSPDGQTYEVFGDYVNGAIGAQTFEKFFAWAVENTDIMDSILALLNMEPHEKKQDDRKRYVPPATASAAEKKVWGVLVEITADIRAKQKATLIDYITSFVKRFVDAKTANDKEALKNLMQSNVASVLTILWNYNNKALNANWEAQIEKAAEAQVEEMQNLYVVKNTRKLAAILSVKNVEFDTDVRSVQVRNGVIDSVIDFKFTDGSSFRVDNGTVMSWAPVNRYNFYRFPTLFSNVVLPGGDKMGAPSEERMNTVFAVAKA